MERQEKSLLSERSVAHLAIKVPIGASKMWRPKLLNLLRGVCEDFGGIVHIQLQLGRDKEGSECILSKELMMGILVV